MNMLEEYARLDILAAITHQNAFVGRRNLGTAIEKAHKNGLDPWRLMYQVLQDYFEPKKLKIEPKTHKIDELHQCSSCQKLFKNSAALAGHGPKRCQNRKIK